ncbi:MAG: leucine-rich repeat protein [Spirochaetia bacterium]|nr:leucine-rich repeat protein [Spirochaetia bacterium]
MIKTAVIFTISLILTAVLFSCGGGGGGADNAIKEVFTISYNANGAEYGVAPAKQSGDEDSPQAVQANTGNLSKSGYLFDGWNTAADGSGTNYAPGSSYKGKNVTLYAKWAAIFNVQVINPGSPAPALNGAQQRAPGVPYIKIIGLTAKGRTLVNINIPSTIDGYQVASIGSGAFQNCDFVTELIIPETVSNIENNAFTGCTGLSTLTIPRSVTSIGDGAFSGCAGLNSIVLLNPVPPTMGADSMEGCTATVSVPAAGVDAYKAAEGWDTYSASIAGYSTEIYTVTFDSQGATTAPSFTSKEIIPPTVTVGQLPTDPLKTGYNFGGWFKEQGGAGGEFTASTVISSNMTVYANWESYEYTVSFDDQGATTPVSPTIKAVASPNTTVGSLPTEPSKDGFYFGGWNTKADGTGTAFNGNTTVASDITVYAVWLNNPTFTVTFDGQGATTAANPSSKQVVSPATTVGELPAPPLKTGYIFGGWYNQPEGAGGEFTASTIVTKNTTVYAKWNSYRYTVTFNGQGADSEPSPSSVTVESPNTTVSSLPGALTKGGFYFGGWNTKSDGTGTSFNINTPVTGDITVYAIWLNNPTYTVTFDSQGATTAANPSSKQVVSPATTVDSLPTPPLRTGYTFGGWYNQPEGSGGEFLASTIVTKNTTVYAKWDSYNYTVTFDSQGATTAANPSSKQVVSPATTVDSLPTPPLRTGYTFGGWCNQPEGSGGEFLASTIVTKNTTVYAKWDSYNYTVTFDSQGATTAANPTSKSVASPNTTINALPIPPEKDGFIFDGWYTQPGGAGNLFTNETAVEGNITVYAKWIALFMYDVRDVITITGLTEKGKKLSSISIPSSIDGKAVTKIGYQAFSDCTSLTDVTIPSSIGYIGDEAFSNCTNIETVNFNAVNCTSMGSSLHLVFSGCSKITTLNIGNNVKNIPEYAFNNLSGLSTVTIPESVTSIGNEAFGGCTNIETVNFNATNCASMGVSHHYAFYGCSNFSTLNIGNNVKNIPPYAFYGSKLSDLTIPNSVTTIRDYAFAYIRGLTNLAIPNSVTSIGSNAFIGCSGLTSLSIPSSVTSIGQSAFSNCTNIETVNFNAVNCTSMGSSDNPAFSGCSKITTISIGPDVKNIPSYAFWGFDNSITVNYDASNCTTIAGNCFNNSFDISMVFGSDVQIIPPSAFKNYTNLISIDFDNGVINIGEYAFQACTSITSITIPNSVTTIGASAFSGCTGLSSIIIGNNVANIGTLAFDSCSNITSIIIPDSVTSIGEDIFSSCTKLKRITIPQYVVNNCSTILYFLRGFNNHYPLNNHDGTGENVSIILSNNVTAIGERAFYQCDGIANMTIPESVTSIGAYAFANADGFKSITIPNSVTSIGEWAFQYCNGLREITFKRTTPPKYGRDNYVYEGKGLFDECTNLTTIKVPAESVDAYKAAYGWREYAAMIVADE